MDNYKKQNKRTALYSRIASSHHNDAHSAKTQMDELRNFAQANGFKEISEYTDIACSGLTFNNRPSFKRLNAAIALGEVDSVIVRSICRIARNHVLVNNWLKELAEKDVEVLVLDGSQETVSELDFGMISS